MSFEEQRIKDSRSRLLQVKKAQAKHAEAEAEADTERSRLIERSEELEQELATMTESLDLLKEKLKQQVAVMFDAKKKVDESNSQYELVSRNISKMEAQVELLIGDRVALIRKCKLEEISLPLADNSSLDEISLEQLDVCTDEIVF
jgi:structural maintenance of chromosome 1